MGQEFRGSIGGGSAETRALINDLIKAKTQKINAELTLDTSDYDKGIKRAEDEADDLHDSLQKATKLGDSKDVKNFVNTIKTYLDKISKAKLGVLGAPDDKFADAINNGVKTNIEAIKDLKISFSELFKYGDKGFNELKRIIDNSNYALHEMRSEADKVSKEASFGTLQFGTEKFNKAVEETSYNISEMFAEGKTGTRKYIVELQKLKNLFSIFDKANKYEYPNTVHNLSDRLAYFAQNYTSDNVNTDVSNAIKNGLSTMQKPGNLNQWKALKEILADILGYQSKLGNGEGSLGFRTDEEDIEKLKTVFDYLQENMVSIKQLMSVDGLVVFDHMLEVLKESVGDTEKLSNLLRNGGEDFYNYLLRSSEVSDELNSKVYFSGISSNLTEEDMQGSVGQTRDRINELNNLRSALDAIITSIDELMSEENKSFHNSGYIRDIELTREALIAQESAIEENINTLQEYKQGLIDKEYDTFDTSTYDSLKKAPQELKDVWKRLAKEVENGTKDSEQAIKEFNSEAEKLGYSLKEIDAQSDYQDEFQNEFRQSSDATENLNESLDETVEKGKKVESLVEGGEDIVQLLSSINEQIKNISISLGSIDEESGLNNVLKQLNDIFDRLEAIQEKAGSGIINIDMGGAGSAEAKLYDEKISHKWTETYQRYMDAFDRIFKDMQKAGINQETIFEKIYQLNPSQNIENISKLFSKTEIQKIEDPKERVRRLTEFFNYIVEVAENSNESINKYVNQLKEKISKSKDENEIKSLNDELLRIQNDAFVASLTNTINRSSNRVDRNFKAVEARINKIRPDTSLSEEKVDEILQSAAEQANKADQETEEWIITLQRVASLLEEIKITLNTIAEKDVFGDTLTQALDLVNKLSTKFDELNTTLSTINGDKLISSIEKLAEINMSPQINAQEFANKVSDLLSGVSAEIKVTPIATTITDETSTNLFDAFGKAITSKSQFGDENERVKNSANESSEAILKEALAATEAESAFSKAAEAKRNFVEANEKTSESANETAESTSKEGESAKEAGEAFANAAKSKTEFVIVNEKVANTSNKSAKNVSKVTAAAANLNTEMDELLRKKIETRFTDLAKLESQLMMKNLSTEGIDKLLDSLTKIQDIKDLAIWNEEFKQFKNELATIYPDTFAEKWDKALGKISKSQGQNLQSEFLKNVQNLTSNESNDWSWVKEQFDTKTYNDFNSALKELIAAEKEMNRQAELFAKAPQTYDESFRLAQNRVKVLRQELQYLFDDSDFIDGLTNEQAIETDRLLQQLRDVRNKNLAEQEIAAKREADIKIEEAKRASDAEIKNAEKVMAERQKAQNLEYDREAKNTQLDRYESELRELGLVTDEVENELTELHYLLDTAGNGSALTSYTKRFNAFKESMQDSVKETKQWKKTLEDAYAENEAFNKRKADDLVNKQIQDATDANKLAAKSYDDLFKSASKYYELLRLDESNKLSGEDRKELDRLKIAWQEAAQGIHNYTIWANGSTESVKKATEAQQRFLTSAGDAYKQSISKYLSGNITKLDNLIGNAKFTQEYRERLQQLRNEIIQFNNTPIDISTKQARQELTKLKDKIDETIGDKGLSSNKQAATVSLEKLRKSIDDILAKNSAMGEEFKTKFKNLKLEIDAAKSVAEVEELKAKIISLESELIKAGKTGKSFIDTVRERLIGINAQFLAQYFSIQDWIRYIRTAFSEIYKLDTALVDLRKTTTMTANELNQFYFSSNNIAKSMGSTTEEIIQQAAEWSRFNYRPAIQ